MYNINENLNKWIDNYERIHDNVLEYDEDIDTTEDTDNEEN